MPPNNAVKPRSTSTRVQPSDFLDCALIYTSIVIPTLTTRASLIYCLAVHLFLVALEADAGDAQADESEREQDFPVRSERFMFARADDSQCEL